MNINNFNFQSLNTLRKLFNSSINEIKKIIQSFQKVKIVGLENNSVFKPVLSNVEKF